MLSTGCRLRAVPKCFPPFTKVQNHFHPWRDSGVIERMMDAPPGLARRQAGRAAEPTVAGSGSQSVRTTEMAGSSGYDAGRRIKGRRRHVTVDGGGIPIIFQIHTADVRDRDGAPDAVLAMPGKAPEVTKLWADSGHRGGRLRPKPAEMGVPDAPGIVERPKETRLHGAAPTLGRGARLHVDVALPPPGEGLRAEPGELRSSGAAGRMPVPDPQAGAWGRCLKQNNIIKSMIYDSNF